MLPLIVMSGCASIRDVTSQHTHKASLMEACVSSISTYLYGSAVSGTYAVFATPIESYRGSNFERVVDLPDHELPPSTIYEGSRLTLEHSTTVAAGIWLYGTATTPGGGVYQVRDLVETVAIDLVDWQRRHGRSSRPSTDDHLATVDTERAP